MNQEAREACLERDNYECQLSKLFGIAPLSGKPCSEDLQAHHKTYERAGHENSDDLTTVCVRCHDILTDAIRRERSLVKSQFPLLDYSREFVIARDTKKENTSERIELQDYRGEPTDRAQRTTRRSIKLLRGQDKRDILEEEEGCSGL